MKIKIGILVFIVVGSLLYANTLQAPFHFDDHELLLGNPHIKNVSTLISNWNSNTRKLLTNLTFSFNYQINGEKPLGYHLVNVILHISNSLLLFYSVRLLLCAPYFLNNFYFKNKELFAFFVSLIFLTHPVQTQAVTYIWQRTEVLSGLFYLLSYLLYLNGRIKNQKKYFFLSLISCCIGFFAKGVIVTLPLVVLLTEKYFFNFQETKKVIVRYRPYILLFILFCLFRRYGQMAVTYLFDPSWTYLFTEFKAMLVYIRLCFLPVNQHVFYYFPLVDSFFQWPVIFSFFALICIGCAALWLYKKERLMSFGIFWFFIYLIPTSTIIELGPVWEHRLYGALIGFSIFFTALVFQGVRSNRLKNGILTVVIVIFCTMTVMRNAQWQSKIGLLEDNVKKAPMSVPAQHQLGTAYYEKGRVQDAFKAFNKTLQIAPNYAEAHNNLGLIYMNSGELWKAKKHLQKAISVRPSFVLPYINLAYIAIHNREFNQADQYLKRALEYKELDKTYVAFGKLYMSQGNIQLSKDSFMKALELNPSNLKAQQGLMRVKEATK